MTQVPHGYPPDPNRGDGPDFGDNAWPRFQPIQPVRGRVRKPRKKIAAVVLSLIALVIVFVMAKPLLQSEPGVGDCLSSMHPRYLGGLEVVDCASDRARYKVVARQSENLEDVCEGHPDGREYDAYLVMTRHLDQEVWWKICADPIK